MLSDICEYSEVEKILIKGLSPHWASVIERTYISPLNLYKILAIDAFLAKREDAYIEALRKGLQALESCKIYRMTPEFDKLIEVKS